MRQVDKLLKSKCSHSPGQSKEAPEDFVTPLYTQCCLPVILTIPRAAAPDVERNLYRPDAYAPTVAAYGVLWQSNPEPHCWGELFLLILCYTVKALLVS